MKKTIYIFILLCLIGFTQCRKDDSIPFCEEFPDQCVEMERIKDHYYFKKDSWWVYEEKNTGAIDSQWVEKSWLNSNNKEFDMVIKSSRHDYDLHRWTHLLTPAKNNDVVEKRKLAYIERSKTKAGDFVGTSYIGIFYPIVGDSLIHSGGAGYPSEKHTGKLRVLNIFNQYYINSILFYNVIEVFDQYNATENSQSTLHMYAKDVGLIKKELIDSNEVWVLKKYDVQQ